MSKKKIKYIPDVKITYTSDELYNALKYFDKTLGYKISNKKSKYKNDLNKRKSIEIGIHNALVGINCVIGEVPINVNKINTKKPIKKVKNFTNKCTIDFSKKHYLTSDIMFRRKFLLVCTSRILKDEKKIFKRLSKPYKNNKRYEKFRIAKDHDFFNSYMKFAIKIIGGYNGLSDSLFDMYYILNKRNISKHLSKYRKKVLKDMCGNYNKIFGKKGNKLMSDIFNISLMLSTGNNKIGKFNKDDFKDYTVKKDLSKMITKLGKKIVKTGISPMMLSYLQCNPKVRTNYVKEVRHSNENKKYYYFKVGILALSFTDYMFNDVRIHYVIREMKMHP